LFSVGVCVCVCDLLIFSHAEHAGDSTVAEKAAGLTAARSVHPRKISWRSFVLVMDSQHRLTTKVEHTGDSTVAEKAADL